MVPADVVASLERYRKSGASASLIGAIDSVAATGANQITIKLKTVQSTFLGNISSPRAPIAIMPAEEAAKEMGKADPIGTGPFRFIEYKPDSHVKVARFDGYRPNPAYKERDGFAGAKIVHVDTVTFRFMPEAGARDAALETGQVHINENADSTTAKRMRTKPTLQVIPVLPWAAQVLKFNMAQGPTADLNFRRAVQLGLDSEEIMAVAYPEISKVDQSWVFAGSTYHTGRRALKQDIAAAKASLAKSPYKGEKLTFIVDSLRNNVDAATVFQQQMSQIGVNVDLKVADWPTTSGIGLKSDQGWNFWTHGFGIEPYEGPVSAMSHWVKGQGQRKADPDIDAMFAKINGEMNVDAQKKIFADFENQMADQAIAINLGNYGLFQVATSRLKNFKPYRIPRMWGVWLE
jgi:peptide/nickel transport system substrate-binding protein